MWRASCRECNFQASRLTKPEAEAALIAHVTASGHRSWSMRRLTAWGEEYGRECAPQEQRHPRTLPGQCR